ncbi:hypothetical protein ACIBCT_09390 [Streptosporangium sp. NPDC050855]|uniref:hypothetical protein n=1 Tax=Streptosporangium sp. NPDC050855 TaxID=3366194 RepID=UPI0037BA9576
MRNRFQLHPGRARNELTGWTSLNRDSLDLPPGGSGTARVKIAVPESASRGERYGVIWAQVATRRDPDRPVRIVNRVGVRVYLDIGRGGEPPSDFRIETLTPMRAPDGAPQLAALVRNTGGRALDMSGTLWLSEGPGGLQAGPFPADRGVTLTPGSAAPVTVTLDRRVPDGPWKGKLTLMSGMVKKTVTATFTFPVAGRGRPVEPDDDLLPLIGLVVGLVLLPAAAGVLVMRRRRRGKAPRRVRAGRGGPLPGARTRRPRTVGAHRRSGG